MRNGFMLRFFSVIRDIIGLGWFRAVKKFDIMYKTGKKTCKKSVPDSRALDGESEFCPKNIAISSIIKNFNSFSIILE